MVRVANERNPHFEFTPTTTFRFIKGWGDALCLLFFFAWDCANAATIPNTARRLNF
jgi:hypothetical protein